MRRLFYVCCAAALLASCNNNKKSGDTTKDTDSLTARVNTIPAINMMETLLGSFVGPFGDNKITLLITKIKGDSVAGRSVVGGNDRPFAGTFSQNGSKYIFTAAEPGDDKYDGIFNFEIDAARPNVVAGSWKPNDVNRPEKTYSLERKKFEYRADVGDYPEASTRLLKPSDVENLMKEDLMFMRNEIFARHGYCFSKKELRQQFEMQDWYVPNTVDVKVALTDIEKKNISLIRRYEKYAEEYGDEYGR